MKRAAHFFINDMRMKKHLLWVRTIVLISSVLLFSCDSALPQEVDPPEEDEMPQEDDQPKERVLAFPGAEGFGKYATGGRGGKVYVVTNLNDDGPGSLREAIRKKEPRTILFALSGNIVLNSPLDINNGDLTIAGHSAPGDGICIQGYPLSVKADNVIIRYLRFRLGDEAGEEFDALTGTRERENIIIDHCSISWATDECASFYNNRNFTLQWCIISESLNESVHEKGAHGYGGIWGGVRASFHHNLFAHHVSRTPRFSGSETTPNSAEELVDFRNNVIYNWRDNNIYGGEGGRYNVVNNYFKPGPATGAKRHWMVRPSEPYGKFYVDGNVFEGNENMSADNWNGGVIADDLAAVRSLTPLGDVSFGESALNALESVLQHAGASLKRDAVDERIVQEVMEGTASLGKNKDGIIDSQLDAGGWPALESLPAEKDSDGDGIPDVWELERGLNPNNPADGAATARDSEYTNLETYLEFRLKGL